MPSPSQTTSGSAGLTGSLNLQALAAAAQAETLSNDPVVSVRELQHSFGEAQVLFDVRLDVYPGDLVLMTGPSGSGKTTLLTLIGALRSAQKGSIKVLGQELNGLDEKQRVELRRRLGFIFQAHNLFEPLTALQNVRMGLELHGGSRKDNNRKAAEILERLGLKDHLHKKPDALSGGQCQRVAIGRALAHRPPLVLADEPTAALDAKSGNQVIELLREAGRENGTTTLLVTHDNRILEAADRIVNMVDGRIASDVSVEESLEICEFLSKVPAFTGYTPGALAEIAEHMDTVRVPRGHRIFNQGDPGDELYIVWEGQIAITDDHGGGHDIAHLGVSDFFGETALVTQQPRNAGAVAREDSVLLTLSQELFQKAMEREKTFSDQLREIFYNRR